MKNPRPSFDMPQRLSLAVQAAGAIRKAVSEGTWQDFMPSERHLSEMLKVSRPTVRTALHLLAREGLLEIKHGRRNKLLSPPPADSREQSQLIGLVTQEPVSHMSQTAYQGISEMRANLAEHGFSTEILVCPPHSSVIQRRKLAEFVRQKRVFCCVLLSVGVELQAWCAEHSLPALVMGSCHPEIKLPSIDVDNRSVCRHAVGIFLSKGHRRIALVVPDSGVAGDLVSEQGFNEAVELAPYKYDVRSSIVRHDGSAQNLLSKLDTLFKSANPPSALLVAIPQHVIFVMTYLLKRGLSVPTSVSLIARDHDYFFEPLIAHYAFKSDAFAVRVSRLILQMATHGHLAPEPTLVLPTFVAGSTVAGAT